MHMVKLIGHANYVGLFIILIIHVGLYDFSFRNMHQCVSTTKWNKQADAMQDSNKAKWMNEMMKIKIL